VIKKFLIIVAAIVTAFFVIGLVLGLLAGTVAPTATTARVTVFAETSLCWSGSIGDATQEGCGRRDYDITSDLGIFAAVVQKQSDDTKTLTVRITPTGGESKEATTTAAYGVVTVTAGG
jgi:hypothetical protein